MKDRVIILGGGPAGLAAGYCLTSARIPSTVFESEDSPGGMCRTLSFGDCRFDLGAHRLHNTHPDITRIIRRMLGDDLMGVNVPSRVHHEGKWAKFPLTPLGLVTTIGIRSTAESLMSVLSRRAEPKDNFEEDAIVKYGRPVAESFLLNYSEKLWGLKARQLTPAVSGRRLSGLSVRSLLKDLLLQRHGEHLDGAFYYPRRGFGQITDALASSIDLSLCKKAVKVSQKNGRICSVAFQDGEEVQSRRFISTVPMTVLLSMLDPPPPKAVLESARSLLFRHLRLAVLTVKRPRVVKSASLYFPDKRIGFTRIYEPKNRSIEMAPPLKTCLVVEYPYFDGDNIDNISEAQLIEETQHAIEGLGLVDARDWSLSKSIRLRYAYPVLTTDAESKVAKIRNYLFEFTNLHIIGRAAEFEYTHFHDLMRKGEQLAAKIARDVSDSKTESSPKTSLFLDPTGRT